MTCQYQKPPDQSSKTSSFAISTYGQLKLSVFKKHEILVVSVLEARDMLSECQGPCNSYVKIGMFPSSDPGERQKTLMVPQCRNPVYLQTFHFAIREGDLHKRLLFTVWNSDLTSRATVRKELGSTILDMLEVLQALARDPDNEDITLAQPRGDEGMDQLLSI
ncbi:regulator of G-protein signaling 3-like [Cyprinodon tularosa]|uniref:regulator of G-protein signaling 3-like n=1 Tax=Cyprinodon tularosa TaxID=77115 RepID=UPI0018E20DB6|nr:regulator of G-protein signaling 3-like [Cyprinodon tularosa]